MARNAVTLSTTVTKGIAYWELRWNDPATGKRRSQSAGRKDKVKKRVAEKKRAQKEAELEANPAMRAGNRTDTLANWIESFTEMKKAEGVGGETIKLYDMAGRLLLGHFDEAKQVHEITKHEAQQFASALRNNELDHVRKKTRTTMARATARKHLANCRAIFRAATQVFEQMRGNPFDAVKLGPTDARQWKKVSSADFWKLYEAANDSWKMMLALCRLAGLRRSDALRLRWSMIDWNEPASLNIVQQKTNRPCRIPVDRELAKILRSVDRGMTLRDDFVVPRPIYLGNIGRDFKVLCKRADVEPYADPLHTLRKSCIDDWAKSGYPPNVVKEWAGHASIQTTMTYYAAVDQRDMQRATMRSVLDESDGTSDGTALEAKAGDEHKPAG